MLLWARGERLVWRVVKVLSLLSFVVGIVLAYASVFHMLPAIFRWVGDGFAIAGAAALIHLLFEEIEHPTHYS